MKQRLAVIVGLAVFVLGAFASEKAVKMKDLPPAVQKAVQEQTTGAELKGLAKEVDQGKTFYEAETMVNGRTRDLLFDDAGALVVVEEEVTLDSIPAPARAAIEKKAAGAKITKVETLTKGPAVTYEARIKRGLKTSEVQVKADGSFVN